MASRAVKCRYCNSEFVYKHSHAGSGEPSYQCRHCHGSEWQWCPGHQPSVRTEYHDRDCSLKKKLKPVKVNPQPIQAVIDRYEVE